jgi:hypothetical protein
VLANLALDSTLAWLLRSDDMNAAVFLLAVLLIAIGVLLGQTLLLAGWIAFSEGGWQWQFGIPTLLAAGLAAAGSLPAGSGLAGSAIAAVLLQVVLWTIVAVLLPLRFLRGWRLTRGGSTLPGDHSRFHIRDLLIWTLVIGVPLALLRLVLPQGSAGSISAALRVIATLALLLLPLLWLAMLAAFAPRGWRQSWLYAAGLPIYAAAATAIATREFYHLVFEVFWFPRPGWLLLLRSIPLTGSFFVLSALVLSLNCLVLRQLGWQLVRPAWRPNPQNAPAARHPG